MSTITANETFGIEAPSEEDTLRSTLLRMYGAAFNEYDFQEALERQASGLSTDVVADYPFVVSVNSL